METLSELKRLPQGIQKQIAEKYGSTEKLYKKILDLLSEDYLMYQKLVRSGRRSKEIKDELIEIEEVIKYVKRIEVGKMRFQQEDKKPDANILQLNVKVLKNKLKEIKN